VCSQWKSGLVLFPQLTCGTMNNVIILEENLPDSPSQVLNSTNVMTILFNWFTSHWNKTLVQLTQLCFPGCGRTQGTSHKVPAWCGEAVMECCISEVWWIAGHGCVFAAWGWVSKSDTWNRPVESSSQQGS